MAKKIPGLFNKFNGLWVRGSIYDTPPDHFSDSRNNCFNKSGVQTRDGITAYFPYADIVRGALYKPNPPFTGTNAPRIIYLRSDGNLFDQNYPNTPLYGNIDNKDFGLVNFFGRCYISPSDGRVGTQGEFVYVYDGTGPSGFRKAAGAAPVTALTAALHLPLNEDGSGKFGVGTYLFSYALESSSGFITRPAPFIAIDNFGSSYIDISNLPTGPSWVAARWIIGTKAIPLRADLSIPFDATTADFYPQFFAQRIADNVTTVVNSFSYYDEGLVESSDYLQTLLAEIPAGVGLMDYKGRMMLYGERANPSLMRGSVIGEPESFSETSGFLITDPTDSTGIRSAVEFRNTLYFFKQDRGYVTQDNQEEPSTWEVVNFEKANGTEQYGIAAVLDAKGSSSEGFIIASRGAIEFFNGTFQQPELSYKIRDLWARINPANFYKLQIANDPVNKRIYALVPLNDVDDNGNVTVARTVCSHVIYGDYRNGLDPFSIKWDLWEFTRAPLSILIYNNFVENVPSLVTRLIDSTKINTLNVGIQGNDDADPINAYFQFAPVRFSPGVSQFTNVLISASGPARLSINLYSMDMIASAALRELSIPSGSPDRDYNLLCNFINEMAFLKVSQNILNQYYRVYSAQLVGKEIWKERPR